MYYHFYCNDFKKMLEPFLHLMMGASLSCCFEHHLALPWAARGYRRKIRELAFDVGAF